MYSHRVRDAQRSNCRAMATKITKAEFDTLPDSLKTKFKADGDDYLLDEVTEDVEGLKRSKAEILAEKKRIQDERDELRKFKTDHEQAKEVEETAKQKEAGEFAELDEGGDLSPGRRASIEVGVYVHAGGLGALLGGAGVEAEGFQPIHPIRGE